MYVLVNQMLHTKDLEVKLADAKREQVLLILSGSSHQRNNTNSPSFGKYTSLKCIIICVCAGGGGRY